STGARRAGSCGRLTIGLALKAAVLGAFSTARPCVPKGNHPPGPAARAAAVALRGPEAREVRVDLARYAELVEATRCQACACSTRSAGAPGSSCRSPTPATSPTAGSR